MYNAEKFIRQCLISVLASKFKDYEVLVVDDCSTDNSVAEVEKLLSHFDGRLKILSTEKNSGGAGIPRNIGIKNAAGRYVTFIDNDDMILPTALGNFYEAAKNFKADVVHTVKAFTFCDTEGKILNRADLQLQSDSSDDGFTSPKLETKDLRKRIEDYIDEKYFWLPCGKFYRRDFLIENKINFPQMKFSEDMIFCFKCMCLAEKYLRVPNVTNIHRVNQNSGSKKIVSSKEGVKLWLSVVIKGIDLINEFAGEQNFFKQNPDFRRAVLKFFIDKHFEMIKNLFQGLEPHEVQKIFYDKLNNPELDLKGKNLIAAYFYTERALKGNA